MKTCKHCGAQLNDDERFCYQCGTSVFGQDNETATVKKQKKLWPFILVFAVILLVLIGQLVYKFVSGSTEKKYNNQLALAERYLDELDYDKAIAAYKAAIEIDPIQAEAYLGLAEVYLEEGNIQAAIDILKDGYEITGTSKLKKRLSELEEQLARMNEAESSAREEENEESQDNDNPSQENEARFTLWNGKVNWRGGKWTNRNDILPHISEDGYIIFGAYEQDGDVSNGPEPIEWEIIEDEEKRVLLASRYILDEQAYNIENDVAKWENCSLRKWLNEDFLTTAFTSKEQKWIDFTILKNPDNPVLLNYGGEIAEGGNDTRDQIFCLEVDEIRKYYNMNWWYEDDQYGYSQEAMVLLTPYAIANGYEYGVTQDDFDFYNLYEKGYDDACIGEYYGNWWLRSIDCGGTGACIVTRIGHFGRFFVSGTQYSKSGVRPALYLLYEQ